MRAWCAPVGTIILLVLIVASLAAPLLTSHDPNASDPTSTLQPPSRKHPMGTDPIGCDVFARFLYGGQLPLRVGPIAIALGAAVGVTIGLFAGYYGGWLNAGSSWLTDVLLSFSDILLALAIIAVLGPGITNAMLSIGIAFIPAFMRLDARQCAYHPRAGLCRSGAPPAYAMGRYCCATSCPTHCARCWCC